MSAPSRRPVFIQTRRVLPASAPASAPASEAASPGIRVHPDAVFFVESDRLRVFTRRGAFTFASKGVGQLHRGIVKVLDGTVSRDDVLKATPSSHHDLVNTYFDRLLDCGAFLEEPEARRDSTLPDASAPARSDVPVGAPVVTSTPSLDVLDEAVQQRAPACVFLTTPTTARDLLLQADRLLTADVPVRIVLHPDAPGEREMEFLTAFADRLAKTPVQKPSPLALYCAEGPDRVARSLVVPPGTSFETALEALPNHLGVGSPAHRSQIPIPSGTAGDEPLLRQVFADVPDRFRADRGRIPEALVTATIAKTAPAACVVEEGALRLADQAAVQAFAADDALPAGRRATEASPTSRPVPPARTPAALLRNAFDVAAQALDLSPDQPVDLCADRDDDLLGAHYLRELLRNETPTLPARETEANDAPAAVALPDGTVVAAATIHRARRDALGRAVLTASGVSMDGAKLDGREADFSAEEADAPGRLLANEQRRAAAWMPPKAVLHVRRLDAWNRTVYTATLTL